MFFEDLERDTFGRLFGKRKELSSAVEHEHQHDATAAAEPRRRTTSSRTPDFAEVSREVRPGPAALSQRDRQVQHPPRVELRSRAAAASRSARTASIVRPEGYRAVIRPFDYRCIGPDCARSDSYCIDACPQQALSLCENPVFETMGDYRWTPDLLVSNWQMAETGSPPGKHLESEVGASGGGFDRLRFRFPEAPPADLRREDISTAAAAEPPQRFAAEDHDRRALVRRRHVVRLDQHPRAAGQGPRGQGLQHASPAPAKAAIPSASSPTRTT